MRTTQFVAAACVLLLGISSCDSTSSSNSGDPLPNFGGTFQGTAQGSSNGVSYSGDTVTLVIVHNPSAGNGFTGTWSNGASSGTLSGSYISGAPNYVLYTLTQTAPCAGTYYGFGNAGIQVADGLVNSLGGHYGGSSCLGTGAAATVDAQVYLTRQP